MTAIAAAIGISHGGDVRGSVCDALFWDINADKARTSRANDRAACVDWLKGVRGVAATQTARSGCSLRSMPSPHPELAALEEAYNATERDARAVIEGLSEEQGTWRAAPGTWSVAECLDHLATANRVYLRGMQSAAARALAAGSRRRRPARPGLIGGWFVRALEPPVKRAFRGKAPKMIEPRPSPGLQDAAAQFLRSQDEVRAFVREYGDIDLAGVRFVNPFARGVRFSLATGLHVIAAHERRHLWQAWRVRRAAEEQRA
jgi:hypothetical protein